MRSETANARLLALIRRFGGQRLLVAGDLMLDEFIWGRVARISPEAPVPVVNVTAESYYPGGAANVARNLREFTPEIAVIGLMLPASACVNYLIRPESTRVGYCATRPPPPPSKLE